MNGENSIPCNKAITFEVGDRVRIKPEWQDECDDQWERIVIEAPENSPRVLIKTLIPGFEYPPTERIEASKLEKFDEIFSTNARIKFNLVARIIPI
jgi:hypothetical protein